VFANDLAVWSKISDRIYIWDYVADFSDFGYMTPYPSWDSLAPNIRSLAATGHSADLDSGAAGAGTNFAVRGLFSEGDDTSMYGDLQELRSYIITRVSWNPTTTGPSSDVLLQEFVPNFYGEAAAPFIFDYIALMTSSAKEHGMLGPRKWEGRMPGLFASICQAYLTPNVVLRAAALLDAASAASAASVPGSRFIDRVARTKLPVYLTVLGRWNEVLGFWRNKSTVSTSSTAWPFEHTFEEAFWTFGNVTNRSDPLGLPASDYHQTPGHAHTMDDSAETVATYWILLTRGETPAAICSK
jgi:hypothetical protein